MSEWWGPPWPGHGEGGRGGEHLPPRGGHLQRAWQERRQEHRAPLQVSHTDRLPKPKTKTQLQLTRLVAGERGSCVQK